jgi:hypothetical protein
MTSSCHAQLNLMYYHMIIQSQLFKTACKS